ncbi:MAG: riboflavin kinase, partial [Bacillota bacterium]
GHRAVIDKLQQLSKHGFTSVVVCFDYDGSLLTDKKILTTAAEKKYLLDQNGPEVLISYKIDRSNKDIPVKRFIEEILVNKLGAKVIVAGSNNENIGMLRECAKEYGYMLEECDTVLSGGESVTADRIIAELAEGRLDKANEMLGHPYLFIGTVMHGKARGRTVGMPTANLSYEAYKQLPAHGVYGTLSDIDCKTVKGLTNIGKRPSDDNFDYISIEAFLLDFSEDIYDKTITLEIHVHIRGVIKFNNLEEVKRQVDGDIVSIRAFLEKY